MKVNFKIILFTVIICIFAMLSIGCEHEQQNNEQIVEMEVTENIEDTSVIDTQISEEELETPVNPIAKPIESSEKTPNKSDVIGTEVNNPVDDVENIEPDISIESNSNLVSLGEFKLTAYCPCSKCCGKWAGGATASGVMPVANHTIAVDTRVIPFGTKVVINGVTYTAEDTGGAIKGNRIDIYFDNHQTALNFGVQYAEVFMIVN